MSNSTTVIKPILLRRLVGRNKILFGFENLPLGSKAFSLVVSNSWKIGTYENEFSSKWLISRNNTITTVNTKQIPNFCVPSPFNTTNITQSSNFNNSVQEEVFYEEISNKITFKTTYKEFNTENFTFEGEVYQLVKPLHITPTKKEDSFLSKIKFGYYTAPSFEIVQANRNNITNLPLEHIVSE